MKKLMKSGEAVKRLSGRRESSYERRCSALLRRNLSPLSMTAAFFLLLSTPAEGADPASHAGSETRSPQVRTLPGTGIELVRIPGGEAPMGSGKGRANELPVHTVRIDPFWIGRYEVSQQQWEEVMGSNPSRARVCPRCPVDSVTWEEGVRFLRKASALSGVKLRFPTEAEWEFAAGGGKARQRWPGTDNFDEAGEFSWYSGNFSGKTKISGDKLPNLFGLYDMGGNVAEWCSDWYGEDYYRASPSVNPAGPPGGEKRVVRGGSWLSGPLETRTSWRTGRNPATRSPAIGLRVAAE